MAEEQALYDAAVVAHGEQITWRDAVEGTHADHRNANTPTRL